MLVTDRLLGLTIINIRIALATDKELLKEVTKELWQTVKKLRPELGKDPRLQLVLKALITIGDLPNQVEAAIVVGVCAEMEEDDPPNEHKEDLSKGKQEPSSEVTNGRRVVRRSSANG
ncbi:Hypothetical protein P9211_06451 [Prochlorococcus marinus str. MIT 9211]|uniref:TIGR03894 family protein n=1 Tax=Prochlorococcus marinus (strain MIT 9211) TaxID=93059 RepID=A9B9R4_PROM4|nr:Hypothetical protein P9211_06451 [Prochlorococcus marinus str. MIT 9211]